MPVDTKALIAEAFLEVSRHKSIDKITIRDIVEHCSISRQAFYYHYQDIVDVIQWIVQKAMQQTFEECLGFDDPRDAMRYLVEHIIAQRDKLIRLFQSQHRDQIEEILMQTFCAFLKELRVRKYAHIRFPTMDTDTALRFFAYGMAGIIRDALKAPHCNADYLSSELYALIMHVFEP